MGGSEQQKYNGRGEQRGRERRRSSDMSVGGEAGQSGACRRGERGGEGMSLAASFSSRSVCDRTPGRCGARGLMNAEERMREGREET